MKMVVLDGIVCHVTHLATPAHTCLDTIDCEDGVLDGIVCHVTHLATPAHTCLGNIDCEDGSAGWNSMSCDSLGYSSSYMSRQYRL